MKMSTSRTTIEEDGTIKSFTDWIKADGSTEFSPEVGRYHIYGQHLCPFAHRVTISTALKGLNKVISYDNVDYVLQREIGWKFSPEKEGCDNDSVNGYEYLREVYEASAKKLGASGFSGRVTVPALYDKKLQRIINNESADILRMFNSEFNEFCSIPEQRELDLYPESMRSKIEEVEAWIQPEIISGVHRPFHVETQEAYDAAISNLFGGLDKVEEILSKNRYLLGKQMTEADIRLFVVLIRFDSVYFLLRCCKKRIVDYPALWAYTRDIYQTASVRSTVFFEQIIKGYFNSYHAKPMNPFNIVPAQPEVNYDEPHNRQDL